MKLFAKTWICIFINLFEPVTFTLPWKANWWLGVTFGMRRVRKGKVYFEINYHRMVQSTTRSYPWQGR